MQHLNVLSATCDNALEEILEKELPYVTLVNSVRFQENLFTELDKAQKENRKIDILLLKETLPGGFNIAQVVKEVRETYPGIRIVFIMVSTKDEMVNKLKLFLHAKQVYDIIYDDMFGFEELQISLFKPKSYEDAIKETKQVSFEDEMKSINFMNDMAVNGTQEEEEVKPMDLKINYNHNIKYDFPSQKTVAYWSPKGGTGVDTLAIMSAVMMTKYTDIDVCILDLASTPNMNLFFNIADKTKNLETLYVQEATGKLNQYTIENYIINGQETACKIPNLYLIPGAIQRINFFQKLLEIDDPHTIRENFGNIIKTLRERFSVVILILSSDIYHIPTIAGLVKSTDKRSS